MSEEIPVPNDESPKDHSSFVEMLKNNPNPAGEAQIYIAFKKAIDIKNSEEPSLTYNELLDLIYPTKETRVCDGLHISKVLPKIGFLEGTGEKLKTIPECFETYKLKLPEFKEYEKEKEGRVLRGTERIEKLWKLKPGEISGNNGDSDVESTI